MNACQLRDIFPKSKRRRLRTRNPHDGIAWLPRPRRASPIRTRRRREQRDLLPRGVPASAQPIDRLLGAADLSPSDNSSKRRCASNRSQHFKPRKTRKTRNQKGQQPNASANRLANELALILFRAFRVFRGFQWFQLGSKLPLPDSPTWLIAPRPRGTPCAAEAARGQVGRPTLRDRHRPRVRLRARVRLRR